MSRNAISDIAYNGMTVSGWTPDFAPNPSCCSDPRYMCPECTAEALLRSGHPTSNSFDDEDDDDDVLETPGDNDFIEMAEDEEREQQLRDENARRLGLNDEDKEEFDDEDEEDLTDNDADDVLPLPEMTFDRPQRKRRSVRNRRTPCGSLPQDRLDDDILGIPEMEW